MHLSSMILCTINPFFSRHDAIVSVDRFGLVKSVRLPGNALHFMEFKLSLVAALRLLSMLFAFIYMSVTFGCCATEPHTTHM